VPPAHAPRPLEADIAEVLAGSMSTMNSIFRGWDHDHSGSVSRLEFRQGLARMGIHADEEQMRAVFRRIDKDNSGHVDFHELRRALQPFVNAAHVERREGSPTLSSVSTPVYPA